MSSISFLTFLSFTHFHCNTLLHSRQVSEKMDEDSFWPLNNSENVNHNESRSNIKEMSILSIYLRSLALYRNCNSFKVCLLVNVWWESVFLSSLNVTWVSFNSTCNVIYFIFHYICNKWLNWWTFVTSAVHEKRHVSMAYGQLDFHKGMKTF